MKENITKFSSGVITLGATMLPMLSVSAQDKQIENQEVNNTQDLPNIVWFLTEDLSPHYMAMYNNGRGAETPNVSWLAENGLTYNNAYSNAPVSSAARTTLITGCYAPRFEGAFHRKIEPLNRPEGLNMIPTYLREKGYYTVNSTKTDYNVKLDENAWDEIKGKATGWRNRPTKETPFFLMKTTAVTHESRLQFNYDTYKNKKTKNSPDNVFVHPYLPDTDLMRYTYATFYDRINDSDRELGKLIEELKKDGLMDNTIIFYFGDNGGSLPGTKGYTTDIGLHVPLVVYVPEKWQNKLGIEAGKVTNDIVSFMDFGPTIMHLAGVDIPKKMDGKPFLGKDVKGQNAAYCYGDRYDEFYSFNRSIRFGKYRYVRNYVPFHSRSLFAYYRYQQLAFQQWKDLYDEETLNDLQRKFFEHQPAEELYDLESDPNETVNLATEKRHSSTLKRMRRMLSNYVVEKADLGFYPETVVYEDGMDDPDAFGTKHKKDIKNYVRIANLQLSPFSKGTTKKLLKEMNSEDPVSRYWALITSTELITKYESGNSNIAGDIDEKIALEIEKIGEKAKEMLNDDRIYVRSAATVLSVAIDKLNSASLDNLSLLRKGYPELKLNRAYFVKLLNLAKTDAEKLLILNDLTYMFENGLIKPFELNRHDFTGEYFGLDWRLKYLNAFSVESNAKLRWKMLYNKVYMEY